MNIHISDTITNFCLQLVPFWAAYFVFETTNYILDNVEEWINEMEVSLPSHTLLLDMCSHFSMCQLRSTPTNYLGKGLLSG